MYVLYMSLFLYCSMVSLVREVFLYLVSGFSPSLVIAVGIYFRMLFRSVCLYLFSSLLISVARSVFVCLCMYVVSSLGI